MGDKVLYGGDCFNYYPFLNDYVNHPKKLDLEKFMSMRTHFEGCERCLDHYHKLEAKRIIGSK